MYFCYNWNMQILFNEITHDLKRDLFWTRIDISSDDSSKGTTILAAASDKYINDNYVKGDLKNTWGAAIVKKWQVLGENLFRNKIHFDIYTNKDDEKAEANGFDYLFRLSRN